MGGECAFDGLCVTALFLASAVRGRAGGRVCRRGIRRWGHEQFLLRDCSPAGTDFKKVFVRLEIGSFGFCVYLGGRRDTRASGATRSLLRAK